MQTLPETASNGETSWPGATCATRSDLRFRRSPSTTVYAATSWHQWSVVDLLRRFEAAGVSPWVDGGWGVDALLGYESSAHADLDLVILESEVPAALKALNAVGFVVLRDWLPTSLAVRHEDGREVDLHPITPTADGGWEPATVPTRAALPVRRTDDRRHPWHPAHLYRRGHPVARTRGIPGPT